MPEVSQALKGSNCKVLIRMTLVIRRSQRVILKALTGVELSDLDLKEEMTVAAYKDRKHLKQSTNPYFARVYEPNTAAPYGGIYRCQNCTFEQTVLKNKRLPSDLSHSHSPSQGPICFLLIVASEPL